MVNFLLGDGKIHLNCLGHCDEEFALATLQKALKANTFSKWLRRIQIAEIEKADVDGKMIDLNNHIFYNNNKKSLFFAVFENFSPNSRIFLGI